MSNFSRKSNSFDLTPKIVFIFYSSLYLLFSFALDELVEIWTLSYKFDKLATSLKRVSLVNSISNHSRTLWKILFLVSYCRIMVSSHISFRDN